MPMDPLNGVSTQRGRNMRETCARVVAAALLTGAIATVVGMSALVDTPREPMRSIAAPPSSLQRSVRLTAHVVPRHRPSAARLVTTHTSYRARRPPAVARRLVVVRAHRAPEPRRQLAAVPAPARLAAASASQLEPVATPPPPDPTAAVPDTS